MEQLRRTPRLRKRKLRSGFTLIESMVALAILAVGLLGMLGMQLQAMRKAQWGRHTSEAARIVGDQLELFNRLPWGDAVLQPTAWTPVTAVTRQMQTDAGAVQVQSFDLQWRITADATDTNLRQVDVRVVWSEADQAAGAPQRRYAASSTRYNN